MPLKEELSITEATPCLIIPPETIVFYSEPNSITSFEQNEIDVRIQSESEINSSRNWVVSKMNTCDNIDYANIATMQIANDSSIR